jgi:hypothetical protein
MTQASKHEDQGGNGPVIAEQELVDDLSLMLMYLSSWIERDSEAPRFWKGFDFGVLDRLVEQGLISSSRRTKSAYLTQDGVTRTRELLARYGQQTGAGLGEATA